MAAPQVNLVTITQTDSTGTITDVTPGQTYTATGPVTIIITLPQEAELGAVTVTGSFVGTVAIAPNEAASTVGVSDTNGNPVLTPGSPFVFPTGTTAQVVTVTLTGTPGPQVTFSLTSLTACLEVTGTTVSPPGTTVSPPGTTVSPPGTTVSPPGTTVSPPGTTVSPPGTTVSPPGTTVSPPGTTVSPPGTTVSPPGTTVSPPGTTVSPTGTTPFATSAPTATTGTTEAPCTLLDQMAAPQVNLVTITQTDTIGTTTDVTPGQTYTATGPVTITITLPQEAELGAVTVTGSFVGSVAIAPNDAAATVGVSDTNGNSALTPGSPFVFPTGTTAKIVTITLTGTPGPQVTFSLTSLTACLEVTATTTQGTTPGTTPTGTPCVPKYGPWEDWGACTPCGRGTRKRVRDCDSCCSTSSTPQEETEECNTCQCRVSIAEVQRELGFITDILGSMEPNSTNPDDLVSVGDTTYISSGTYVYGYCHVCYCDDDGNMNCNKTGDCACTDNWGEWGPCSADCGSGTQTRTLEPVPGAPLNCSEVEETRSCESGPCTTLPPICWSAWSDWTPPCAENTCGQEQTRKRSCINNCTCSESEQTELRPCPTCPTTPVCEEPTMVMVNCTTKCERSCKARRPGYTCVESEVCQMECGCAEGYYMQNNVCVKEDECNCYNPANDQEYPPNYTVYKNETCERCSCASEDGIFRCEPLGDCCVWASWTPWSGCSSACKNGTHSRSRNSTNDGCDQGTQTETEPCEGDCGCVVLATGEVIPDQGTITANCSICTCEEGYLNCQPNPAAVVDGNWSTWTQWSQCSIDCRDYSHTRSRQCNNPEPECGGAECAGPKTETAPCSDKPCCLFSWSEWSPCSVTCYEAGQVRGTSKRYPIYVNATESSACSQLDEERECGDLCECNIEPWSTWSDCSVTCGMGQRTRYRSVPNNIAACENTPTEETDTCFAGPCECTNVTEWSNYTRCQPKCHENPPPDCAAQMEPGCVCKHPLVLLDGECVEEEKCYECVINGTTYGPGERFNTDKCTVCECVNGTADCYVEQCQPITDCNPETHKIVYNPLTCCDYECKPKTCEPVTITEQVRFDNCVSTTNITYKVCQGECGSSGTTMDFGRQVLVQDCKCCMAIPGPSKPYAFNCDNTLTTIYIPTIENCKCNECVSEPAAAKKK